MPPRAGKAKPRATGRSLLLAFALATTSALPAAAQPPIPDHGTAAIGGSIGAALPAGDGLDKGPQFGATLEGYLRPRVSVRGELGLGWMGRRGFRNDLRPLFFNVNLVYNWQRGVWHPFITGGLGLYRYTSASFSETLRDPALRAALIALGLDPTNPALEGSDNKVGGNLGGGIEYFVSRRSTIVGDFRYHGVGDIVEITPFDGAFFSISVGLKRYF